MRSLFPNCQPITIPPVLIVEILLPLRHKEESAIGGCPGEKIAFRGEAHARGKEGEDEEEEMLVVHVTYYPDIV